MKKSDLLYLPDIRPLDVDRHRHKIWRRGGAHLLGGVLRLLYLPVIGPSNDNLGHRNLERSGTELGLNPDRQTVRPRDCLITEILPLHQGNQTVNSNQSTTPTLVVVLVILFRCCAFAL